MFDVDEFGSERSLIAAAAHERDESDVQRFINAVAVELGSPGDGNGRTPPGDGDSTTAVLADCPVQKWAGLVEIRDTIQ